MGKNINSGNYMQVVPNEMIDLFTNLYSNPDTFSKQPTKMLWGQPGIGKSQAVGELAKHLEAKTHKKVVVTTASLLLMSPIDLRGIPTKDTNADGDMVAKWLTPEIFKMSDSDKVINILFLDEISAAPPSVQAAAYQICLDKRVGEHKLPENCFVIAAGNRVTDKAVAYKMPKPLGNRLTHFEMVCSVEDWKKWAYKHDIDTRIIGFINHDHQYLNMFDTDTDDVAFPTPRSWEMVDTYLKSANDFNSVYSCIAGSIGLGTASAFKTYISVYDKLPNWEDIASGKTTELPKNIATCKPDTMYALSTLIASRCSEEAKKVNIRNKKQVDAFSVILDNVATFIDSIPRREYVVLCCKDMFRSNDSEIKNLIFQSQGFSKLMDELSDEII
jgi:hypothetical protein